MRCFLFLLAVAVAELLAAPGTAAIDQGAAPTAGVLVPRLYKNSR